MSSAINCTFGTVLLGDSYTESMEAQYFFMNYKQCLELIRYSLNPKDEMVKDVKSIDWEEMLRFADEQGILGLMYEGSREMEEG